MEQSLKFYKETYVTAHSVIFLITYTFIFKQTYKFMWEETSLNYY